MRKLSRGKIAEIAKGKKSICMLWFPSGTDEISKGLVQCDQNRNVLFVRLMSVYANPMDKRAPLACLSLR